MRCVLWRPGDASSSVDSTESRTCYAADEFHGAAASHCCRLVDRSLLPPVFFPCLGSSPRSRSSVSRELTAFVPAGCVYQVVVVPFG